LKERNWGTQVVKMSLQVGLGLVAKLPLESAISVNSRVEPSSQRIHTWPAMMKPAELARDLRLILR